MTDDEVFYHMRCPSCGHASTRPEEDIEVAKEIVAVHLNQDHGHNVQTHNVQVLAEDEDAEAAKHAAFVQRFDPFSSTSEKVESVDTAAEEGETA